MLYIVASGLSGSSEAEVENVPSEYNLSVNRTYTSIGCLSASETLQRQTSVSVMSQAASFCVLFSSSLMPAQPHCMCL